MSVVEVFSKTSDQISFLKHLAEELIRHNEIEHDTIDFGRNFADYAVVPVVDTHFPHITKTVSIRRCLAMLLGESIMMQQYDNFVQNIGVDLKTAMKVHPVDSSTRRPYKVKICRDNRDVVSVIYYDPSQ